MLSPNLRITNLAADRRVHQAFRWFHLHEPQLRRWQLEFLAIPAPPFAESARATWFCERLRDLGLHNPHIDEEGNALAELNPEPSTLDPVPCVLLSAHLDTVFPADMDCTPKETGHVILGPGACDNGAGLTGLLALAAAMQQAQIQPACTLLFAANVGEEGEGDLRGMRHIFSADPYASRIRAAIALEGSGNATVVDRALAGRRLRVTVAGPGGHSWADAGRPNPILALASGLLVVDQLPLPADPRTTLTCGTIQGGTSVNSIPAVATADLDLRSTSSLQLDRTELAVLQALTETMRSPRPGTRRAAATWEAMGLKLHVERIGDRPGGTLAAGAPLRTSLQAVDRHLNLVTEPHIGSTDANLPLSRNIPALAIGAGGRGSGIHTLSESYDPTGRDLALRRILLLVLDACALAAEKV